MTDLPILQAETDEPQVSEKTRCLGTLGRLLSYPDEHYLPLTELLYLIVQTELPDAAKAIAQFGQFVEQCRGHELEETYTRTFDVNPSCALEVGWHLFGEDYLRGQFLVRMRNELAKHEIAESGELPDHLSHVLALIASLPDQEAKTFSHACVFPALHKMQTSLDKHESPYRHLIRCLVLVLESRYGVCESWGENDERALRDLDAFPGQNGRRPRGMGDPLRSYPMPVSPTGGGCGSHPELVPLHMQFQKPGNNQDQSPGCEMGE